MADRFGGVLVSRDRFGGILVDDDPDQAVPQSAGGILTGAADIAGFAGTQLLKEGVITIKK